MTNDVVGSHPDIIPSICPDPPTVYAPWSHINMDKPGLGIHPDPVPLAPSFGQYPLIQNRQPDKRIRLVVPFLENGYIQCHAVVVITVGVRMARCGEVGKDYDRLVDPIPEPEQTEYQLRG